MNRILDHTPSPEEEVISRILVQVHKAVDTHFPNAQQTSRQFTKTVFSEEETESTAIVRAAATGGDEAFADNEETAPDNIAPDASPPTPDAGAQSSGEASRETLAQEQQIPSSPEPQAGTTDGPQSYISRLDPMKSHLASEKMTELPQHVSSGGVAGRSGIDWITVVSAAVLLAGLVMLVYLLFG